MIRSDIARLVAQTEAKTFVEFQPATAEVAAHLLDQFGCPPKVELWGERNSLTLTIPGEAVTVKLSTSRWGYSQDDAGIADAVLAWLEVTGAEHDHTDLDQIRPATDSDYMNLRSQKSAAAESKHDEVEAGDGG